MPNEVRQLLEIAPRNESEKLLRKVECRPKIVRSWQRERPKKEYRTVETSLGRNELDEGNIQFENIAGISMNEATTGPYEECWKEVILEFITLKRSTVAS